MLHLKGVSKSYIKSGVEVKAVNNLSLEFKKGELTVIHGESGSGKSTLLMMLGGMMQPDEGELFYNESSLYKLSARKLDTFRRQNIGFIFQKFHLLPYFSLLSNVELSSTLSEMPNGKGRSIDILKEFGLGDRLNHLPSELSIGQQQRGAMARALVHNPDIILADEPTGNLDDHNRDRIMARFKKEAANGKIVIIVTHDMHLLNHANNSICLKDGQVVEAL